MQNESRQISVSPESLKRRHEAQNPPVARIALVVGLVPPMIAACLVVVWMMLNMWTKSRPLDPGIRVRGTIVAPGLQPLERFPKPNLQISPHDDLMALQTRESAELGGYAWIDRKSGVVRIPIDRALQLIARRGLPARATNQPARTGKSEFELARERLLEK